MAEQSVGVVGGGENKGLRRKEPGPWDPALEARVPVPPSDGVEAGEVRSEIWEASRRGLQTSFT